MNIGAIIQARMSSKRFPGKVMYEVCGKPLLGFLLKRLSKCKRLDAVVVATSTEKSDSVIYDYCQRNRVPCHRGSLDDVAGRFREVIDLFGFDGFVRLCGDSPLLDHRLVDEAVDIFSSGQFDLVTNVLKRTYPKGQSVEVINSNVFRTVYPLMKFETELEHVTTYFYEHSSCFAIFNFESGKSLGNIQLSVDTPADMQTFESMIAGLERPHWEYGYDDLVDLVNFDGKILRL